MASQGMQMTTKTCQILGKTFYLGIGLSIFEIICNKKLSKIFILFVINIFHIDISRDLHYQ